MNEAAVATEEYLSRIHMMGIEYRLQITMNP
jgi:hypothetical protein